MEKLKARAGWKEKKLREIWLDLTEGDEVQAFSLMHMTG